MQYFFFILKTSFEDLRRNKLRAALTSLGILIGISSVILLTAFGLGLKKYIKNQFEILGSNLLIVLPGKILDEGRASLAQSGSILTGASFDERDLSALQKINRVSFVVPAFIKTVKMTGNGKSEISDLYATTADIFSVRNLEVLKGDIFTKNELRKRSKTAVMGPKIAKKLFGEAKDAVGGTVQIENTSFKVIGVLEPKGGGGFGGPDFDSYVYLPYTSALVFNPNKDFFTMTIKVEEKENLERAKAQVRNILSKRYEEDDFSVVEQTEILGAVTSIFAVLNMILVGIAAISLIVGGVGIMNIMYVSVTERTKEIGIKWAIGATNKDILFQFLIESVILSVAGGIIALFLSFIIVFFVQRIFPAYINLTAVFVSLLVSSVIGIVFGVFPAKRASKMSPIEAIRETK